MLRSTFILGIATITACGGAPVTFCERLEANAAHVKTVLAACPTSGDENIYGFDSASCESKASSACSSSEQAMLLSTGACDAKITACASPGDRSRVVNAIGACAEGTTLSFECASALNP